MKAGIKTTEFWVTVASALIFVLVQCGVFQGSDSTGLNEAAAKIVSGLAMVISGALYIWSRARIKGL